MSVLVAGLDPKYLTAFNNVIIRTLDLSCLIKGQGTPVRNT